MKKIFFTQLQCKDFPGTTREIVFIFKGLEIWSIISPTVNICRAINNYQGTLTFIFSIELYEALRRERKGTSPPTKIILIFKIKLALFFCSLYGISEHSKVI